MAANSFGQLFRITTWGESHGKGIGVVIDGCPAGLELDEADIAAELAVRAPGGNPFTSPRKETDKAEIYSGIFEGKTTGAPISIIIHNHDAKSNHYEPIKNLLRPGHANYTYIEKYGCFDYRGGGRSSARETACRVAAGAVAKKILRHFNIEVAAYIKSIGEISADTALRSFSECKDAVTLNLVRCPDPVAAEKMMEQLTLMKELGDSLGGVVEMITTSLPVGLGDPVYEKIEANLAKAMLTLPATKGFEMGEGFAAAALRGSQHNDTYASENNKAALQTNHAGGTLGGITTGLPLIARVAFKPTSSIRLPQPTVDISGQSQTFALPEGSRHDPCVAIRAVPVVSAMAAIVLVDALLLNRCVRLD